METKIVRSFALLLLLVALTPFAWAEEAQPPTDKAAVVNTTVITQAELDSQMRIVVDRLRSSGRLPDVAQLDQIRSQVLENLIARELLYQQTLKKGIKVSQEEINEQLINLKSQFPNEAEFNQALTRMDLTEASIKEKIQRDLALKKLIDDEIVPKVTVTDSEIRAFYDNNPETFKQPERVKASHILIKVDPKADSAQKAEAKKKIDMVQAKLQRGEDFGALAKEYSEGPSAPKGGDLGYFSRGQMVKPFEDAAFAMKPGEVSGMVETRFGYHLIKVTDKTPEGTIPYADVKEKLGEFLKQRKIQQEIQVYVKNLEEKAKIEKFVQ
ncbi:MAG: peptidylprolyl isomerase [Deltaproteobacteria bacterium]|nr:peptidylprolyl isomerase [Deltaproteobacteria bacterium]